MLSQEASLAKLDCSHSEQLYLPTPKMSFISSRFPSFLGAFVSFKAASCCCNMALIAVSIRCRFPISDHLTIVVVHVTYRSRWTKDLSIVAGVHLLSMRPKAAGQLLQGSCPGLDNFRLAALLTRLALTRFIAQNRQAGNIQYFCHSENTGPS